MVDWKFRLEEALLISACLEGFFYGKISIQCALTGTLAKEVQLFSGLGLYSGIFVIMMYSHFSSNKSRMATVLFYALCLLYVLSTATIVIDLLVLIIPVSNNLI